MTKKQKREAEQKAALRQRIADVYCGAQGGLVADDEWATADLLSRVLPALRALFDREGFHHLFFLGNLDYYDTIDSATDFFWDHGVRADFEPEKEK